MGRAAIDVPRLFELWNTQISNTDICVAIGVSRSTLDVLRMRYKLPRRLHLKKQPTEACESDPTPEEIESRAAQVRAGWSEEEEQRRIVGRRRSRWSPPRYCFDGRDTAFVGVSH